MHNRHRQVLKIMQRTKDRDIQLYCAIYLLGRVSYGIK